MRSIFSFFCFRNFLKGSYGLPLILCLFLPHIPTNAEEPSIRQMHFEEVESTLIIAKNCARELLAIPGKWFVVTANRQTKNSSADGVKLPPSFPDNLYATFVTLFPKSKIDELPKVLQISTLSIAEIFRDLRIDAGIMWPNDIFSRGSKVGSCFCEVTPSPLEDYFSLLVTINLNVNMTREELKLYHLPTTSMLEEAGQKFDKERVLNDISDRPKWLYF